jgi:glycerol-1-phosphate dehydrogenase [NAD(P)+]
MIHYLDHLLDQHAARIATRRVVIARDLAAQLPELLRDLLPRSCSFLLVTDRNIWPVAGQAVSDALTAAGFGVECDILEPDPASGHESLHPEDRYVDRVEERLRRDEAVAIAVGCGTLNDIAKLASFRAGRPYAVVGTAPSMNGWTSAIAAAVLKGLKSTVAARGPVLVAADLDVLCQSPARMISAGYADMMAKWVAAADWRLADWLIGSGYDALVEEVSLKAIDLLEGREEAIAAREPEAIAALFEALCISGLSMALAGSSSHISGAEHLFSHYIEMMIADVADRELHGRQVGIGTLCSAALYEELLAWSPGPPKGGTPNVASGTPNIASLDIEARVRSRKPWREKAREIEKQFGPLASVVLPQAKELYAEGDELRARMGKLVREWPTLRPEIAAAVCTRAQIEDRLRKAGAPLHYRELGLTKEQVCEILRWAKDIRGRYTILHLAADVDLLDEWIERAVASFQ